MALTLKTVTLGCKVNQYETEYVRQGLLQLGYRDAEPSEPARLCIVNTCTVTREGDAKSRQIIRRLARDNPQAQIIVMGCYATRAPEEVAALPRVSEVVTDKRRLPQLLERFGAVEAPTGISHFGSRHRAYLKVQDGCYLRCSYCIIPQVRQAPYSRPEGEILAEVHQLLDHGYRELVLTGVHLGHYGVDRNRGRPRAEWTRLADLVRRIAAIDGDFRVRLSSIEATELTTQLVDVLVEYPDKLCPHVHVCLQSGSDRVLQRMRRRWPVQTIVARCEMLSRRLDRPALTTDVLVGFPGETEHDFQQTCDAVREIGFSKIHVFPFSPRQGTPACDLPDQVPKPVRSARVRRLIAIGDQLRAEYLRRLQDKPLRVLLESTVADAPGQLIGTAERYVPVQLPASRSRIGELVTCVPRSTDGKRLYGGNDGTTEQRSDGVVE